MDVGDFAYDLLAGLLYGFVGLALMGVGWAVLDRLIPGRLGDLICRERRRDAGLVAAAGTLAIAAVVTSGIVASDGNLGEGLAETAGFGAVGIILIAVAFVGIDRITPGSLGEILADEHEDQPSAWVMSAALIGIGAIIAAAVS